MKKLISIALIGLLFIGSNVNLHAETPTGEDDPFAGIDIVTEENAVPIDKNAIEGMKNAEMSNGITSEDSNRGRAASWPYWDLRGGTKKFYDGNGTLMYNVNSKMVIDVSMYQGTIDWNAVKKAGVDGAIIRITYGYGNGFDPQFVRNISECNRLGIPYGIYIYSYAFDANFAYAEAESLVSLLSKVNVNLSYPIYYDIEGFDPFLYKGVTRYHPTSPAQYKSIIATFISYMNNHGYGGKTHVYSYRSYLQNELNSSAILPYVSWIAAYTQTLGYTNQFYNGVQGWQYTSDGSVAGIAGRVDMNCFSDIMFGKTNATPDPIVSETVPDTFKNKLGEQNIKFNSGYLTGVSYGGDISTLKNALSSEGEVTLYGVDGKVITGGKLATGQVISVKINSRGTDNEYRMAVIVRGDVNGDGKISGIDYVKVRNKIDGKLLLNSAESRASDINSDGKTSGIDYVRIRNHIDGKTTITQ